jgi:hypothetical protein
MTMALLSVPSGGGLKYHICGLKYHAWDRKLLPRCGL